MESTTEIVQSSILTFFFLLLKVLFPFSMPCPICGFRTPSWNELPLGIVHIQQVVQITLTGNITGSKITLSSLILQHCFSNLLDFFYSEVAQESPPRQDLCVLTRTTIRVLHVQRTWDTYIYSRGQDAFMRLSSLKIISSTLSRSH